MPEAVKDIKDIRITDPDTRRIVRRIQQRRGDSTATKTAANLIRERAMQLEGGANLEAEAIAPASSHNGA